MLGNNILEVRPNVYSKTYQFADINYQIARQDDQEDIFIRYGEILNCLDISVEFQISIQNKHINKNDFNEKILIKKQGDRFDEYREEYNNMIEEKLEEGRNDLRSDKYLTLTTEAQSFEEAKHKFNNLYQEIQGNFKKLGSDLREVSNYEKVTKLKEMFRDTDTVIPKMSKQDYDKCLERQYMAPDYFEFKKDYFMYNEKYARAIFVRDFPSFLNDKLITELTEVGLEQTLSINIKAVEPSKAIRIVRKQITGMEGDKMNAEKKAIKNGYSTDIIPHTIKHSLSEAEELLDDLISKNQKMFLVNIVIIHTADSYRQLNIDTDTLKSVARKFLCNTGILYFQQEDGMKSALPIGNCTLDIRRTLTTESTAVLMPFSTQEMIQDQGMYYGLNAVSRNLIMFNRKSMKNANGFILGTPGSGKSFAAKREMANVLLNTNDDVIIVDPEREYSALVQNFGGEIINISAASSNYINPLDMTADYSDDEDPIVLKSEFILSLCECIIGGKQGLTTKEKAIIDRCLSRVYREYVQDFAKDKIPTLLDFYNELMHQSEPEAKELALSLEIYVKGSLKIFANKTNIDLKNRLTCFDIKDLGKQLTTMGLLIVLDNVWNRITENRAKGKNTWIYLDEIYLLFKNEYSANFLFELYKRARKWGGIPTGITQNVEDLLESDLARKMLSNSDFIQMLNQATSDRVELARLLNISETQISFVTNSNAGQGLLFCGNSIIPFTDQFPTNTKLYKMMTTKLEEM